MSQYSDLNTLINRARKAGLNVGDLYPALSARMPESNEQVQGSADCNGYVAAYTPEGQRVFQPAGSAAPTTRGPANR